MAKNHYTPTPREIEAAKRRIRRERKQLKRAREALSTDEQIARKPRYHCHVASPVLLFAMLTPAILCADTAQADLVLVRTTETGCANGHCNAGVGIGGLRIGAGVGVGISTVVQRGYSAGTPLQQDTDRTVWILTAGHALERITGVEVQYRGKWYRARVKAKIVDHEHGIDCGLVYAVLPPLDAVYPIGEDPAVGDVPFVNGFPYGKFHPRQVHITRVGDSELVTREIFVDGESGGPLFLQWRVAGVAWGNAEDGDGSHGRATTATALRTQLAAWGLHSPPQRELAATPTIEETKPPVTIPTPPVHISKPPATTKAGTPSSVSIPSHKTPVAPPSSHDHDIGAKMLNTAETLTPAILWALGLSGATATGGVGALGIWAVRAMLRRRRKRREVEAGDMPDKFPNLLERNHDETRELLQLRRLERRDPLLDAITGVVAQDLLGADEENPDLAKYAKALRDRIKSRVDQIAPLSENQAYTPRWRGANAN